MISVKINRLNKQTLKLAEMRIEEALAGLGQELGLEFKPHGGTFGFTDQSMVMKLNIGVVADGVAATEEAEAFKLYAHRFGLKQEDMGRQFEFRGDKHTVTGLRPNSYKFPVTATRNRDGKVYYFPASEVLKENV